ncbi:MAG: cytochrome-c peroxidase [Saprospiraceae bacterium]|nr:cytochrome-c peroxidase [Saprospiraceae bacterium]MBP7274451.1 cytochrome-c peroxidase [Saprospiraceae bacterium]
MKSKNQILLWALLCLLVILLNSFGNDPNLISKKNVKLVKPDYFPKAFYNFKNNKITPERFVLGRMLFYDPILSQDSTISCASCHQQFAAFAHIDHKLSHGINNSIGIRNVPALQNLIWKDDFMWDGGVNHIEIQPINPITDKVEMNESLGNVIKKLQRSNYYKNLFRSAYNDTIVTSEKILKALTQFTGLMISANSKYDRYVRKEVELKEAEQRGLILFRQKCNSCHTAPLFTINAFENNGLKVDSSLNDLGRGKITGNSADNYKFKIPSLRNVEVTFPYMHDGRFSTLKKVLDHYSNLSTSQKSENIKLQTIGVLSETDKQDLIAFLKTLTDKTFLLDRRFNIVKN